ncbi:hypothetical protein [Rhodococcus sp. NPDC057529]|uniref:hypothetical protein n=1 Tax=Rhodococcus sp. NPDC057529 TaxID=3346158 RepID=UPI0036706F4D
MIAGATSSGGAMPAKTEHDIDWAETVIARLGADGAHVTDGSDRPKLVRALGIRQLVTAYATDA